MKNQRRDFIKKTTLGAVALGIPNFASAFSDSLLGQNVPLKIGVIGCNGMGWSNTISMLKNKGVKMKAKLPFSST